MTRDCELAFSSILYLDKRGALWHGFGLALSSHIVPYLDKSGTLLARWQDFRENFLEGILRVCLAVVLLQESDEVLQKHTIHVPKSSVAALRS